MNARTGYIRFSVTTVLFLELAMLSTSEAETPVALRVQHFTVPPATGPVTHVLITNLQDAPYTGTVNLELLEGWEWSPAEQPVSLAAYETKAIPFTVEKASNLSANVYPVKAIATGAGETVVREQTVVCASAPYGKPAINGSLDDWTDSLPVAFEKDGKKTTIHTLWNRRTFYLAVAVEEEALTAGDAIQFALTPSGTATGDTLDEQATRYEFLFAGKPSCHVLAVPGMPLSTAAQPRTLDSLETLETEVAVAHENGITYYECAIPFAALKDIRPSEGREFYFSVLVHDPDGTGLRDWGESAGLSPSQRNPQAWCLWGDVQWGDTPPYDNKIEWGLCSSIH
jgi:hypothetical protein